MSPCIAIGADAGTVQTVERYRGLWVMCISVPLQLTHAETIYYVVERLDFGTWRTLQGLRDYIDYRWRECYGPDQSR